MNRILSCSTRTTLNLLRRDVTVNRSFHAGVRNSVIKFASNETKRNMTNAFGVFSIGAVQVGSLFKYSQRVIHCQEIKPRSITPNPLAIKQANINQVKELTNYETFKLLWDLIKPDFWLLLATAVTAFLAAFINLKTPGAIGKLVNIITHLQANKSGTNPGFFSNPELNKSAITLLGLFLSEGILTFVYVSLVSSFGENLAERVRHKLFSSMIRQDIPFFDFHKTGDLLSRLTSDVQDFKHSIKQCVSQGLKSITQTGGGFISLMMISKKLTGVIGLTLPFIYLIGSLYGRYLRYLSATTKEIDARSTGVANECISNIRTVRAFAMEDVEEEVYMEHLDKAASVHKRLGLHIGLFQALTTLSFSGMFLVVMHFGGSLVSSGNISGGDLISYLLATQTMQRSLGHLVVLYGKINKALGSGSRIFQYIKLEPSFSLKGGKKLEKIEGKIEFKNVAFIYPTRPEQHVFTDLSLTLPPGKILAICGSSGSGKSTIASLIERFYEPLEGEILLDGVPISTLDPSWLRTQIGFINQEPTLFGTTVLENIRYGRPGASYEEVIEAAKLANADEFIRGFPNGYKTKVGERGTTLSGGQKQRIAIARALLKNPKILILDEATSALDTTSERLVQEALDRLMKGRTVLVIAHRLSTIQNADQIVVLSKGNVLEQGTHTDLIAKGGVYSNLYKTILN